MKIKRALESRLANLKSTKPALTEMYTSKSTPQSPPHDKQATLKPTSAKAIDSSKRPARKLPAGTNDSLARYVMSEANWAQRDFEDRMDEEFAEAADTVEDDLENFLSDDSSGNGGSEDDDGDRLEKELARYERKHHDKIAADMNDINQDIYNDFFRGFLGSVLLCGAGGSLGGMDAH